jgi:catalase
VVRQPIGRTNDYGQAGERYRSFAPWERDDLIRNLVSALSECDEDTQERMIDHLGRCDEEYGNRVADGLRRTTPHLRDIASNVDAAAGPR